MHHVAEHPEEEIRYRVIYIVGPGRRAGASEQSLC